MANAQDDYIIIYNLYRQAEDEDFFASGRCACNVSLGIKTACFDGIENVESAKP